MADPIPASDAALLAAQAKAGQAGVDAYKAAQEQLVAQRQQALQQAMQEAALRGAPIGAMESISSTITTPYDQGIRSMTEGSANFQAEMAARDRRYADYNAAVQAARGLIPGQVEMAVAPIRAQGDYQLASQRIAGDRAIGEIDANTRLALARMQANADAARIQAEKDAAKQAAEDAKLTQGQLGAQLSNDTLGYLTDLAGKVRGSIAETQGARAKAADIGSVLNPFQAGGTKNAKLEGDVMTFAAKLVQAAIEKENREAAPARSTFADPFGGARSYAQDVADKAAGRPTRAERFGPMATQGYRKISNLLGQANEAYGRAESITDQAGRSIIPPTQLGDIGATQLGGYSEDELGILAGAPRPFTSAADVEEMLLGAPIASTDANGATSYSTNPYAASAFQLAGRLAGGRLQQQGYDVSDQDILQALGMGDALKAGSTAYDVGQVLGNQPTAGEQIKSQVDMDDDARTQAEQQTKDEIAAMDARTKADEEAARQAYFNNYGKEPPQSVGTARQIAQLINQFKEPFFAAKAAAQTALAKVRAKATYDQSDEENAIRQAMHNAGIESGTQPGLYEILRDQLL